MKPMISIKLRGAEAMAAFRDNPALLGGGGIYARSAAPLIDRCTLRDNEAHNGGAVTMVRSNFLCTVYGPNSNDELQRLGRDVLA